MSGPKSTRRENKKVAVKGAKGRRRPVNKSESLWPGVIWRDVSVEGRGGGGV